MEQQSPHVKTLLLLRHAKSSWKDETLTDYDRPLNKRGLRDAPHIGEILHKQELLPDLIISSSARRAHETTTRVVEASGYEGDISFTRELYQAGPEDFIKVLHAVPHTCKRVLLVAHNPGLEMLLETLTGLSEHLPTGALVEVQLPIASWQALHEGIRGQLRGLWIPRTLA